MKYTLDARYIYYMNNDKTQKITTIAILSALSVVANIFSIQLFGSNYLTFTYTVSFVAGTFFGAIVGGAVGIFGDLLGCLINPQGAYQPLITLSALLIGVIPALVWRWVRAKDWLRLVISLVLCLVICTAGLNTLSLWIVFNRMQKGFFVYLAARLPWQALMAAVNGVIIYLVLKSTALLRYRRENK
jgi:ECF transporter S component (folate family)